MTTVTADIAASLDGFAAGPNQSKDLPFGEGLADEQLHTWMFDHADENRAVIDAITAAGCTLCRSPWARVNGSSTGPAASRSNSPASGRPSTSCT
jgi:hypothetical protein